MQYWNCTEKGSQVKVLEKLAEPKANRRITF